MEAIAERVGEGWFAEVDNVLQHIVTERILDKGKCIRGDLANELCFLMTGSMVDAALEDATAMTMSTDNHAIGSNSIEDELDSLSLEATTGRVNKKKAYLSIFRVEAIKALLDHMVAIKILDQLNHPIMQSDDDHMPC